MIPFIVGALAGLIVGLGVGLVALEYSTRCHQRRRAWLESHYAAWRSWRERAAELESERRGVKVVHTDRAFRA